MSRLPAWRHETDLPTELTSFVGRRRELAGVRQLLSSARLVTLTGVGGVGKTRLALQVARNLQRASPAGVCLVDLAGLTDETPLADTVAAALGLRTGPARWTTGSLADRLAQ